MFRIPPKYKPVVFGIFLALPSALYTVFTVFIQFFYTDVIKLPAHVVGRGWFMFGFWNTFNDPLSGNVSDIVKAKFGSRMKLIKLLIIPFCLSFAFIWMPRFSQSNFTMFIYFLLVISIFDLLFSMLSTNTGATVPEVYKTLKERANIAFYINFNAMLFAFVSIGLAPMFYGYFGWTGMGIVLGFVVFIALWFSKQGVVEKTGSTSNTQIPLKNNLANLFRQRYFINLMLVWFMARLLMAVVVSVLPFYVKYHLLLTDRESGFVVGILLFTGILSLPIWNMVIKKWGSKKSMHLSLVSTLLFSVFLLFDLPLVLVLLVIAIVGFCAAGSMSVPQVMTTEVIEYDTNTTGIKREGLITGFTGMALRFPPALTGLALGELLGRVGYDPQIAPVLNPSLVGDSLQMFLGLGIIVTCLIAIFVNRSYEEAKILKGLKG